MVPAPETPCVPVVSESPLAHGVSAESVVVSVLAPHVSVPPVVAVSVPVLVPHVLVPLVVAVSAPVLVPPQVPVPLVMPVLVVVPCVVVSAPCVVVSAEVVEVDGEEEAVVVSDEVVVVSVDGVVAVVELCWVAESAVVLAVESVALVYESPDDVEVDTPVPVPAVLRLRSALFCRTTELVVASAKAPMASDSRARCAKILLRFILRASSTAEWGELMGRIKLRRVFVLLCLWKAKQNRE